ncbi:hypothetical protein [Paenibacillus lutrae]|uniref:Uncharacterized protein n=1 Tax=Paenibacillus lutrae TaxID=2078573 RepID=A0A7X3FJW5_9BACL|nr:hypothetical protein [Paenibacillus lutrae]MVP00942.1 hypothetical protein [Paenibacillus lutrae]
MPSKRKALLNFMFRRAFFIFMFYWLLGKLVLGQLDEKVQDFLGWHIRRAQAKGGFTSKQQKRNRA